MQIDSYELYHIGSKLNPATDFNTLKSKLKEKFAATGYSVINEPPIENLFLPKNPVEVIATKDTVRVEHNILAQALNVIGTNVDNVQELFNDLINELMDLEYEIDDLIIFYEIIATVIIKVDERPIDILNRSLSLDTSSFPVKDIPDWDIYGIKVRGTNNLKNAFFNAFIEPNPTNPNSRFKLKLQYRSREKENIQEFSNELDLKIRNLIANLG